MPQLDIITFATQIVCLFLFYFYLYLKFLKNVIGTTIAVLTVRKYYLYQQYATAMVHLFKNKKIKKQVAITITKYLSLFSKSALPKYIVAQHIIESADRDTLESDSLEDIVQK